MLLLLLLALLLPGNLEAVSLESYGGDARYGNANGRALRGADWLPTLPFFDPFSHISITVTHNGNREATTVATAESTNGPSLGAVNVRGTGKVDSKSVVINPEDAECLASNQQAVMSLVYTAFLRLLGQGILYDEDGLPRGVPDDKLPAWAPTLSQGPTADHPAIVVINARQQGASLSSHDAEVAAWYAAAKKQCPAMADKLQQDSTGEAATRFVQKALKSATERWAKDPMAALPAPNSGRRLLGFAAPRAGNYSSTMHNYQKMIGLGLLGAAAGSPKYTALALADLAMLESSPIDLTQAAAGVLVGSGLRKKGGADVASAFEKQAEALYMKGRLASTLFNLPDSPSAENSSIKSIMKQYAAQPLGQYAVSGQTVPLLVSVEFDGVDALSRGTPGQQRLVDGTQDLAKLLSAAVGQRNEPLQQSQLGDTDFGNALKQMSATEQKANKIVNDLASSGLLKGAATHGDAWAAIYKLRDYEAVPTIALPGYAGDYVARVRAGRVPYMGMVWRWFGSNLPGQGPYVGTPYSATTKEATLTVEPLKVKNPTVGRSPPPSPSPSPNPGGTSYSDPNKILGSVFGSDAKKLLDGRGQVKDANGNTCDCTHTGGMSVLTDGDKCCKTCHYTDCQCTDGKMCSDGCKCPCADAARLCIPSAALRNALLTLESTNTALGGKKHP